MPLDTTKSYTITARVSASAPTSVTLLWLREAPIGPVAPAAFPVTATPRTITLAAVKPPVSGTHHVQVCVYRGGFICRLVSNKQSVLCIPALCSWYASHTAQHQPPTCSHAHAHPSHALTQFEFGLAAAGTVVTIDDIVVTEV